MITPKMKALIALGGFLSIAHASPCKPSHTATLTTTVTASETGSTGSTVLESVATEVASSAATTESVVSEAAVSSVTATPSVATEVASSQVTSAAATESVVSEVAVSSATATPSVASEETLSTDTPYTSTASVVSEAVVSSATATPTTAAAEETPSSATYATLTTSVVSETPSSVSSAEPTTVASETPSSSIVSTTSSASASETATPSGTSTTDLSSPTACSISTDDCPATGFTVEYYSNDFMSGYGNNEMTVAASYYISEDLTPLDSSVTTSAYFAQDYMSDLEDYSVIYPSEEYPTHAYYVDYHRTLAGGIVVDGNNFTLVYTGYYKAPSTGTYTLCVTADNANTLYFGRGNAFSCSTGDASEDASALTVTATGYNFNNPTQCDNVDLVKGEYYPVRNVMGNKNAVSMFEFTIQPPDGTASHDFTDLIYPVSCGL